jgi:hypothetical protein
MNHYAQPGTSAIREAAEAVRGMSGVATAVTDRLSRCVRMVAAPCAREGVGPYAVATERQPADTSTHAAQPGGVASSLLTSHRYSHSTGLPVWT